MVCVHVHKRKLQPKPLCTRTYVHPYCCQFVRMHQRTFIVSYPYLALKGRKVILGCYLGSSSSVHALTQLPYSKAQVWLVSNAAWAIQTCIGAVDLLHSWSNNRCYLIGTPNFLHQSSTVPSFSPKDSSFSVHEAGVHETSTIGPGGISHKQPPQFLLILLFGGLFLPLSLILEHFCTQH